MKKNTTALYILRSAGLGILCGAAIAALALWHGQVFSYAANASSGPIAWARTEILALQVPPELQQAHFIAFQGTTTVEYAATWNGFAPSRRPLPPAAAAVFAYPFNAGVTEYDTIVSPDGQWVAFTQPLTSPGTPAYRARVSVASAVTQSQQPVGDGFLPLFVDSAHVARFAPEGIVVTGMDGSGTRTVLAHPFAFGGTRAAVAPHAPYAAFADSSTTIAVYAITATSSAQIAAYSGPFDSLSLSDTALYALKATPAGTQVTRVALQPGAAPKLIATLPAPLAIRLLAF